MLGVLIIANYGVILYISLGMTGYWPLLLTSLWVLSTFPGNIFCAFFVERFGRRRFMLIGLSGILVSLICETAIQATYLGTDNRVALNFGIFFIFLVSSSPSPDLCTLALAAWATASIPSRGLVSMLRVFCCPVTNLEINSLSLRSGRPSWMPANFSICKQTHPWCSRKISD